MLTHLDLVFLGDIGPVLGGNTGLPIELDSQRRLWFMIERREASHVVSRLSSGERELTRFDLLSAVVAVPIRGSDLSFRAGNMTQIQMGKIKKPPADRFRAR